MSEVRIGLGVSQVLVFVAFMFSFVLAMSAAFLAAPAIAGDVESGTLLAMLARPISRADLVLGRWIGLCSSSAAYAIASGVLAIGVVAQVSGYTPPDPVVAVGCLAGEAIATLTLALALGTRLPAIAAGSISVVLLRPQLVRRASWRRLRGLLRRRGAGAEPGRAAAADAHGPAVAGRHPRPGAAAGAARWPAASTRGRSRPTRSSPPRRCPSAQLGWAVAWTAGVLVGGVVAVRAPRALSGPDGRPGVRMARYSAREPRRRERRHRPRRHQRGLQQTKFILPEDRIPRAWYNIAADLPVPPPPPLHPGTGPAHRPGRPGAAVPDGAHRPGGQPEREIEIPGAGAPGVRHRTGRRRSTGPTAWRRAGHAGPHLLQVRGRQPGRQPQAQHGHPAGFYNKQEGVKRLATETGAGQWGTALASPGALFGLEVKVYMVRASYDQKPYRRNLMEIYGGQVVASPSPDTNYGRSGARGARPTARARWASPSARRSRMRRPATTPSTPWARCSTTCCCTRRSSASRPWSRWRWPASKPDILVGLRRRRLQLRGPHVPVPRPEAARRGRLPDHRGGAGSGAQPDPGRLPLRLRRHRQDGAHWSRCTPWATTSSPSPSTPAACATTAWRRW